MPFKKKTFFNFIINCVNEILIILYTIDVIEKDRDKNVIFVKNFIDYN